SAVTATLTEHALRFEAVRLPDGGWTVADELGDAAIVRSRPWDQAEAEATTDALNAAPGYAALFRWAELDSWMVQQRDAPAASGGGATPTEPEVARGDRDDLCAFCWQPAAPGAWVELRLYAGPGQKIGELSLKVCAGHLAALRPAYERGFVECRATRWETAGDYPPGSLGRRPGERPSWA
ncbi:MAG TPA: hypothetical protein VOB72_08115, partial [Candidatus Dormibacteraeota bacterium]|nr:hypothetical protein [Candidatus Dormibacteraeota bacterium]